MTNILFSSIFALVAAAAAPNAAANDGPAVSEHRRGHAYGLCERIECSDDQRARIDTIRAEHKEEMADERAEMKRLRGALKAELDAPAPNAERVASLRAEIDALRATMHQGRTEARTEMKAVLTDAQREQLAALKAERKAKGHDAKGKGHGKDKAHGKGKGKGHGKGKGKAHGKGQPDAEAKQIHANNGARGPDGKALRERPEGPKGKLAAKERAAKGKAHAKGKQARDGKLATGQGRGRTERAAG